MSTTREPVLVMGHEFTHDEVLSIMRDVYPNEWSEEYLKENKDYFAMLGEELANHLGLFYFYRKDYTKSHVIGYNFQSYDDDAEYIDSVKLTSDVLLTMKTQEISINKKLNKTEHVSLFSVIFSY